MATTPNDNLGSPATPAPGDAEGIFDQPPTMPPMPPQPAQVTLTIDLGTLTPATVAAIQSFVSALANDPAKGAGIGPRPGAVWPATPGEASAAGGRGKPNKPKS